MKFCTVIENTLPKAYHSALMLLKEDGEISDCADYNTTQLECNMTMHIYDPLCEPIISKLFIGGPKELRQYELEMLDGILDFEIDKGNWAYTYHNRMGNQIDFVIDELKRNPSSRRAVIDIRDNMVDMESNDPACLQHIQYFIRNNKLECDVLFRSNDACKATFMNAFALIMLQKRIADRLGVEVGSYTHRANSFHCYERDFDLLEGYYKRITTSGDEEYDLCYNYTTDWKELMESYDKEIFDAVEILKNRGNNYDEK